jgi:hypothetical protein
MSLIKRDRPNILVESEERHRPGSLKMIRDLLEPVGYQGYFVFGKEFVEIEQFSLDRMQSLSSLKADGTDRLAENLYINNFIFLTEETTGAAVAGALKSSSTP